MDNLYEFFIVISVFFTASQPTQIVGMVPFDNYVECKQATLDPRMYKISRFYYSKKNVIEVKTDCIPKLKKVKI
jgi:hypothetical protein